jgi:hypothetical protein
MGVLNDGSHHPEAGAMFGAFVPDDRLDAFAQAELPIISAVITGVRQDT